MVDAVLRGSIYQSGAALIGAGAVLLAFVCGAGAQQFTFGESPLSTVMKWRPTTADPEVKDFVRASRPDEANLDYTPLRGPRAERPKLKTKSGLQAVTNELDAKAAALRARAGSTVGSGPSARKPARSTP